MVRQKNEAVSDDVPRYMPIVEWFARHFSQAFSEQAIKNAVPSDFERREKTVLPRALDGVGLKSSFVLRDLREIDPVVLPCVCFKKNGDPIILLSFAKGRKFSVIVDLKVGPQQQEVLTRKLRRSLDKNMLLVTPRADVTASRLSPDSKVTAETKGHWFWKPVRENWSAWAQIVVAAFAVNLFGLAVPIFVMNVYDRVIPNLAFVTLWTLSIGVVIALLLDLLMRVVRTNVLETASRRIDLVIASSLFRKAMNVKLLTRPGGAAGMANTIRDFELVREFITSSSFIAIVDLAFIGIFILVLWVIVGPLALVPLLAVPVVIVFAMIAQVPIAATVDKAKQLATKRHIVLIESLLGIETIKSLNAEPMVQKEWENAVASSARINSRSRFWSNFAVTSTMLVQQGVSVVIIVWGVYLVSEGTITIGALIAANILSGRILAPLGNISQTLLRAQHAIKSMSAIREHMKLPVEASDEVRSELRVPKGELEFKKVTYTYPGAQVTSLKDIDFKSNAGETIALLGRVGSGKTTLGKLIAGLLEPESGIILVDGHEIQQIERAELRSGIGYLPQDPELFTGTIRENILLGWPHATEDEINRALYFAGLDQFVAEHPEGLDFFVGEKGNRLSGGQRQAVSIARLIIRKPKMLFLDEPTNAMDNQTETTVIERLKELKGKGVSMILSTHRNSLAAISDRMIVLEKGQKVLDGSRDEVVGILSANMKPAKTKKDG